MKLHKKQRPSKKIIFTIVAALVVIVSLIMWYLWSRTPQQTTGTQPTNTINYNPPTEEEKQAGDKQKEVIVQNQKNDTPTQNPDLRVFIVRTFQDPSGFNIRSEVDGTTTGDCLITFTKDGQPTVTKTFPVVFEATSSSCQNTPISPSDFSVSGSWNLQIIVKKDGMQSAAATTTVEVKK
jgi:hypothetical protein